MTGAVFAHGNDLQGHGQMLSSLGDTVTGDPLSHRRLRESLKGHMVAFLPDDGLRRSSHAFRIGSAQSLARAGGSLVDLQTAGRWRDPSMPARYCKGEMARRGAVARLRYGKSGGGIVALPVQQQV